LQAQEAEDRFSISGPAIQPIPQNNPARPQNNPAQRPQNNQQIPANQRPPQNPQLSQNNDNVNQFLDDNNVCGVPVVNSQSLVVGGEPVQNHGEWPW
jgi:hypothetical protein